MLESRAFRVVFVSENHGVGIESAEAVERLRPVFREADYSYAVKCASMPTSIFGFINSASTTGS